MTTIKNTRDTNLYNKGYRAGMRRAMRELKESAQRQAIADLREKLLPVREWVG